ncbi:uncharacterized protein involved in exopolysaccharide biosynthesis [Aminivibrio pyruvatiphilus]|uniref:Uncharacterized protein involved in exopolysaccharide biosynthesis n=1 Tax=Aminivibrio pyruvatiphilus TaxID=1005740 RepID=A0A4R8LY20_9BACT|nr:GNVR domain-containing protein [Aminivibrio pyruvatiphilus]TDY52106.1 uncharacterized protein involved in exopolysaccharide biosynthesis [Aminivibrio pyruvatiphilus]
MTTDRSVQNTPAPYQDDDEIDLMDLFMALWKQKWVIVICAALFVAAGTTFALLTPKTYEAKTTLLILPPISRELTDDKNSGGQMFSSEIYKDLALAQDLLNDVIAEVYSGTEQPDAAAAQRNMSVSVNKASEKDTTGKLPFTLSVSLKGEDPAALTSFLSSWITHFTRRNAQLFSTRGTQSFEYISENFEIVKKDLKAAEDKLADYRKQHPIDFLENTLTTLKTLNKNYQEDISFKKRTLVSREAELIALKELIKEEPEIIILNRSPSNEMLLNVPRGTDSHKNENLIFRDEVINERHSILRNMITFAETEVQSLKASIADLEQHLKATEKEFNEKQVLLVESKKNIQRLEREEKALNDAYTNLAKKFQETRIAAAEAADPIRVIEQPVLPTSPVAPRKTLIVALSGVLGLFIGIFAALIVNMVKNRTASAKA